MTGVEAQPAPQRRLLLVDDDGEVRETLTELLELEGFDIVGCANGRDALIHLSRSARPDLILLDFMMPFMNGAEFRTAQLQNAAIAGIPVVLFSAAPQARESVSADLYLTKPLEFNRVLEAIEQVLRTHPR